MTLLDLDSVIAVRARIARAQQVASIRFRDAFAAGPLPPVAHLRIQAEALIESAVGVRLNGDIAYDVTVDMVTPYVERGKPIYPYFEVARTPEAIFEYWLIISEIETSTSWKMTRVIATAEEYSAALGRMQSPQIVRALVVSFLPDIDIRADGTAMLEATVYARSGEERIERRTLLLDVMNELHFHGRELIAEGRGGVRG
ncbi:MAG: hypothetical protein AABO58_20560 [Acidobacteriota bacterium]